MSECDRAGCDRPAYWLAYAAYETGIEYSSEVTAPTHPITARYPMPMVRACSGEHLTWELGRDAASATSTRMWVVTPA